MIFVAIYLVSVAVAWGVGVVPRNKLLVAAACGACLVGVVAAGLWRTKARRHKVRFGALVTLAAIGAAVSVVLALVNLDVAGFVGRIQNSVPPSVTYVVVAPPDHPDGVESLGGEVVGFIPNDPNVDRVRAHLTSRVEITMAATGDITKATQAVVAGNIDAAAINLNIWQVFEENDPGRAGDLKVIYQFEITQPLGDLQARDRDPKEGFIVYISGIDVAGPLTTVSRSDVNMLMVVNPTTHKVLLVNTPRDYYVQLHGTQGTKDKLTHAGIYGIDMSINTLQDVYGVEIDYYVRLNFSSMVTLVDTVGPIQVNSDYDFTTGQHHFVKGWNEMNGTQALAFSRARKNFAEGDRQRGKHQQAVIDALIRKLTERPNLLRYNEILTALEGTIGTNVTTTRIRALVDAQLSSMRGWQVESISVDGAGASEPTYSMGSMKLYVMVPDQKTVDAAKTKIDQVLAGN
ncbi:MAG: LCP family protein [Micrococcales bacterium]|nr:LCP family protein [Micrococcales bacterium]